MSGPLPARLARTLSSVLGIAKARTGAGRFVRPDPRPTIVPMHGAFADGSSWRRFGPLSQRDGDRFIAVQKPPASLDGDMATIRRVPDVEPGPVVPVGSVAERSNTPTLRSLVVSLAPSAPSPSSRAPGEERTS